MPPRRKRRAPPAKAQSPPPPPPQPLEPPAADAPLGERLVWGCIQDSERQIAAIKAAEEADAEGILSWLQMLQSYFTKEQLEANALDFFRNSFPNVSPAPDEESDQILLKWNDGDKCIISDLLHDCMLQASISSLPALGALQFPNSVGKNLYGRTSLGLGGDSAWSELPADQIAGAADAFQTPGAMSNRLSFGMTPKTVRLPKNGEVLLSVHGSPLGVYKEENLAAIQETGNISEDAPC